MQSRAACPAGQCCAELVLRRLQALARGVVEREVEGAALREGGHHRGHGGRPPAGTEPIRPGQTWHALGRIPLPLAGSP